jgi:xanthine dehydrogenase accessory factor
MTAHVLSQSPDWIAGRTVALATVVATFGSSPSRVGTSMVIEASGHAWGSLSGGCVEADVHARGLLAIECGKPELVEYGVSDDDAFTVGLTCGGTLHIFIEPVSKAATPHVAALVDACERDQPATLTTVVTGPHIGKHEFCPVAASDESDAQSNGGALVLNTRHAPRPRMLIVGATHFAAALASVGALLGYRVTVCDARATFTTRERFPDADEVVVTRPDHYVAQQAEAGLIDARTVVCVVSHDPRFDVPVLRTALGLRGPQQPAYIGALGSRRTHAQRTERLAAGGVSAADLARLHSPIGLDLGAATPHETAVAIAAEIIAVRRGGSGRQLRETQTPIRQPAHA